MTSKRQLSEADLTKIKGLSESFTEFVLGDIPPAYMCLKMCYPLFLHLKNKGFENISLRHGIVKDIRNGVPTDIPHHWINLEDSQETIIDPTIRQFSCAKTVTSVYIGNKTPCPYDENPDRSIYNDIVTMLLLNFSLDQTYKKFKNGNLREEISLDNEREIILKAAIIINNEIGIKLHSDYFSCVKQLLCEYSTDKELEVFSGLEGFCKLKDICSCK